MEALANVNEFGFCELQDDELMEVDGGSELGYDIGQWFYGILHSDSTELNSIDDNNSYPNPECAAL